jgi:hypothetical protein
MTEQRDIVLRPNRGDPLHDLQLQRDVEAINERTVRALGPPPFPGQPMRPPYRRRLHLNDATLSAQAPPTANEDPTMQWTSVAAIAALATSTTLAACGANGTQPEPTDRPAIEVPDASTPIPAAEAVPPAAESTEARPDRARDARPAEPVRGPAIPAAQLGQQILTLLGSLQTLEDLEHGNVERAFKVSIPKNPDAGNGYYFYKAETIEGWTYWIDISRLYGKDQPSTTYIYLDSGAESETHPPAHCTLEFQPLAKKLVAMGYEQATRAHYFGGDLTWGFGRNSKDGTLGFGVGVIVYTLDSGARTCIGGIRIGGGALDE